MAKYLAILFRIVLLFAIVIFAIIGCASASALSYLPSENQEEWVQKTLTDTWRGYVKDNSWARIENNNVTLEIYKIRKGQNDWTFSAILNWQSLEYIKLNIYNGTVMLEMMDRYGGFYTLKLYQNTYLLGKVYYGFRTGIGHDIVLEKISR